MFSNEKHFIIVGALCNVDGALCNNVTRLIYPSNDMKDFVKIVGSCNGMICLANESNIDLIIWNPIVRKAKPVPFCGLKIRGGCYVIYGFGYVRVWVCKSS